jgi:phospholipase C
MAEIKHVVVLMLENRSFDSMLGRLVHPDARFDGLTGNESNIWNGASIKTWSASATQSRLMNIPEPGPHERFTDMTEQIFGANAPPEGPANMSGFVSNYMKDPADRRPETVMHGFTPEQVGTIRQLALAFGVSDRWHASAPNQTWPNRFFAHTGTAGGYVDNDNFPIPFRRPTIFNRLKAKDRSWRIYYHDAPHALLLREIWSDGGDRTYNFKPQFFEDAESGNLPNYSFIEPRYFPLPLLTKGPNDQHPSHNVLRGERLIARCYNALRNGPGWKRTLFIITYDEHGGLYDHVAPPAAVPPDDLRPDGFAFDRYGVRVPAILISPWIAQGTLVRPPDGHPYPFDHTSILATLRKLFSLGAPLTARDAAAPDLTHALSLPEPTNDGPAFVEIPEVRTSQADLVAADREPPNSMQVSLAKAAAHLPPGSASVPEHDRFLARRGLAVPRPPTVRDAREQALNGVRRFLHGPGDSPQDLEE